jgi:hypothetical protein
MGTISSAELKASLIIAKNKILLMRNKKASSIQLKEKELVKFIQEKNMEVAKAKMRAVVIEENLIAVYDTVAPLLDIIKEKLQLLMYQSKKCPDELQPLLETVIYTSLRVEVEELHKLRDITSKQYGETFVAEAAEDVKGMVNQVVKEKLNFNQIGDAKLMIKLKQLALKSNVQFEDGNYYDETMHNVNEWGQKNPYEG